MGPRLMSRGGAAGFLAFTCRRIASMGPRLMSRGGRDAARAAILADALQWGRGS